MIRDSWMSVSSKLQESYVWGSWIDDAYQFPNSVTSAQSEGNISVVPPLSVFFHPLQIVLKLKCCQWFGR